MSQQKRHSVMIPEDVYKLIQQKAEDEGRTIIGQIRYTFTDKAKKEQ